MSQFPLPAIIFLCFMIFLLIVLALIYQFVLKKGMCCHMEGHVGEEEKTLLENGDAAPTDSTAPKENEPGGGAGGQNVAEGGLDVTDTFLPEPTPTESALPGTPSGVMTVAPPAPSVIGAGESASTAGDTVRFIVSEEVEPLSIAGKILVQFTYMPAANKINLTVIRAGDMPAPERGGAININCHLCVLPMRKQRFRTKTVHVSKGVFNETFQFIHITKDLVETCAIRLRVYGTERFSKRLVGELRMPLAQLDLTSPLSDEQIWKNLSPKGLVAYMAGIDEEDEPDVDDW